MTVLRCNFCLHRNFGSDRFGAKSFLWDWGVSSLQSPSALIDQENSSLIKKLQTCIQVIVYCHCTQLKCLTRWIRCCSGTSDIKSLGINFSLQKYPGGIYVSMLSGSLSTDCLYFYMIKHVFVSRARTPFSVLCNISQEQIQATHHFVIHPRFPTKTLALASD